MGIVAGGGGCGRAALRLAQGNALCWLEDRPAEDWRAVGAPWRRRGRQVPLRRANGHSASSLASPPSSGGRPRAINGQIHEAVSLEPEWHEP